MRQKTITGDGNAVDNSIGVGPADVSLWSTKQVADYLACAEVTVRTWRRSGTGPKYILVTPRQVRYRPSDVEHWLQSRTLVDC